MFSVIYVLTSVIYVSNTLGSIYGHHDDLPHFGGIFDRSLRSPLLFWSLFFLVFKSLNINANFILLLVSNTTKTDCFVFFFLLWQFMQFATYCFHVLISQSSSYLHVRIHFTTSVFMKSSPIGTNTDGLFISHRVFFSLFFPLQCCSKFL